jgi:hypothetical protein
MEIGKFSLVQLQPDPFLASAMLISQLLYRLPAPDIFMPKLLY